MLLARALGRCDRGRRGVRKGGAWRAFGGGLAGSARAAIGGRVGGWWATGARFYRRIQSGNGSSGTMRYVAIGAGAWWGSTTGRRAAGGASDRGERCHPSRNVIMNFPASTTASTIQENAVATEDGKNGYAKIAVRPALKLYAAVCCHPAASDGDLVRRWAAQEPTMAPSAAACPFWDRWCALRCDNGRAQSHRPRRRQGPIHSLKQRADGFV